MNESIYKDKAKKIGVEIKPSKNKTKKFDAYKDGVFQNSFGAKGYMDYEKYKKKEGKQEADKKRRAYRARHKDDMNVKKREHGFKGDFLDRDFQNRDNCNVEVS